MAEGSLKQERNYLVMDKGIYMMCKIKLPIAADSHEANSGNVEPHYPWQLVCI